jgi:outer membrane protein insertion porin family
MQRNLLRFSVTLILTVVSVINIHAQEDTSKPTSIDPKLLEWKNARIPREYTIANVSITGIRHLDTSIVYSIANLQPGDKFMHPGADIFGKSIANLWRQKLFSNVQIYVTRVEDDKVWIEVKCTGASTPG